jgi:hypothetical protein
LPRVLFITLETCSVIRSCLDEEAYPKLCRHPEVSTLEASARQVLGEFVKSLDLDGRGIKSRNAKFEESRRWEKRYEQTRRQLEGSGIKTKKDQAAGWKEYRANREEWELPLWRFARHLGYDWDEVTGDSDLLYAADEEMEKPRPKDGVKPAGHDEDAV